MKPINSINAINEVKLKAETLQELVVETLEERKGRDIISIDVQGKSSVTDIMVICSGGSTRQVNALADWVIEKVKEQGVRPLGVEGRESSRWVLVDLGDVVVHIMLPETRDFYNLEKLWGDQAPSGHG